MYTCLQSYLSPTLRVWAWVSVWLLVFGSKPASGAGIRTWALLGDTLLTAVQASPSSFHKQDRSGRSSTALMGTEMWRNGSLKTIWRITDKVVFHIKIYKLNKSLPEEVLYCLLNEVNGSPISAVFHQTLCQRQLALPKTWKNGSHQCDLMSSFR